MESVRFSIIIAIVVLITFVGVRGCSYSSLKVADKYETQVEGVTKSLELLKEAKERAVEIKKDKESIKLQVQVALGLILLLFLVLIRVHFLKVKRADSEILDDVE